MPDRQCQVRCSIVVSISACHADDPGSIPGGGMSYAQQHVVIQAWHMTTSQALSMEAIYSATGTRARVARVRAEYPNQLDYSGCWLYHPEAPTP